VVADPAVARVLAAVRRRWCLGPATAIPVDELAVTAGVSRAQLQRAFKGEFGHGPAAVLRALRLLRAADLLRRTDCDLATVAADTGFADPFHLSHAFKRLFGLAPRVWRAAPDRGPDLPWERTYRRWAARLWGEASHDNLRPE
jgi:AraC family transcriptional regulator